MKSPGIPDSVPIIKTLVAAGISPISEIEFAARYTKAQIIAITGSNGKTTTTLLTHHILKSGGLHVGMAGNIGDSFAKMVLEEQYDYYVLEVSSFQLDGIREFRPAIAVITNITPDHLDRYEYNFDLYRASKFRITMNQKKADFFIYDADDPAISDGLQEHGSLAKRLPFSLVHRPETGSYMDKESIYIKTNKEVVEMTKDNLALEGQHNLKNTMPPRPSPNW